MRVIFMGSADLACPSLQALCAGPGVEVAAIVTQPDRPKGRKLALTACSVKQIAAGLAPLLTPERVNAPESLEALRALRPDLIVVVAYGQFLGRTLLELPPLGCINLHASLLPRYRGAAPVQWAIANGESVTGVTTMHMNAEMDAGDILLQEEVAIAPEDTAGALMARLAGVGAALLARTVADAAAGRLAPRPQDHAQATFAPKLRKQDGDIRWTRPAAEIYNRVRGFNPWPGCTCRLPGARADRGAGADAARDVLKVHRVAVEPAASGAPGQVLETAGAGPLVAAGAGAVRLLEVQPAGGKPMSGAAFLNGRAVRVDDVLE